MQAMYLSLAYTHLLSLTQLSTSHPATWMLQLLLPLKDMGNVGNTRSDSGAGIIAKYVQLSLNRLLDDQQHTSGLNHAIIGGFLFVCRQIYNSCEVIFDAILVSRM